MTKPIYNNFTNNLPNYINDALRTFAQKFQTCIPAIVKSVESRDTVVVSPAVLLTNSDGLPVKWSDITTTVLTPFSSGVFLSMPVSVGDTGWLVGADFDTDKFKQGKTPAQQTVFSTHKYQYGFFVPDAINGYTVSEDDNGAWVISTLDGKTKITLKDKKIELSTDGDLKINAKNVTIDGSSSVKINNIDFLNHTHGITGMPNGDLVANLTSGIVQGMTDKVTQVP